MILGGAPIAAAPISGSFTAIAAVTYTTTINLYRMVYVARRSTAADRTAFIQAGPSRTAYIKARENENTRTVLAKR